MSNPRSAPLTADTVRCALPLLAILVVVLGASPKDAQPAEKRPLPELGTTGDPLTQLSTEVFLNTITGETRAQIQRCEALVQRQAWEEAVGVLVRLASESDSQKQIVSSEPKSGFLTYGNVSRYVQWQVSKFSDGKAIEAYRRQVDPLTQRLWLEAQNQADTPMLERLVREQFFCSYGDDAAWALGELALEAGEFGRARSAWESLHPAFTWHRDAVRIPYWQRLLRGETVESIQRKWQRDGSPWAGTEQFSIAETWGRLVIVSILEGNIRRADVELQLLEQTWPTAHGKLSGKQVPLVTTLRAMLNPSREWTTKEIESPADWGTFAGNPQRNSIGHDEVDISLKTAWSTALSYAPLDLSLHHAYDLPLERAAETSDRLCSHFPCVIGDRVFLKDGDRLRCLNLATGRPNWSGSPEGVFYGRTAADAGPRVINSLLGAQRSTLTANRETLVATVEIPQRGQTTTRLPSCLIGFDLTTEGSVRFGPVELDDPTWLFHGSPLCDEDLCWVSIRQQDSTSQDFVACYDMRSGKRLWLTRMSSAETVGHGMVDEAIHGLLTLHEGTIYVASNLGAVCALDSQTGEMQWLTTYPRSGPRRENLLLEPWYALRDLTPCIYFDGMVIAAPADCRQIFALHAKTGELIWQTELARDATQILGVTEGQLIISGRRLWWLDAYTGRRSHQVAINPFPAHELAGPTGFGRGLISGDCIYWPTQDEGENRIYVVDLASGYLRRQPIDLDAREAQAGNLVLANGYLLIAAPDRLYALRRRL